MNIIKSLVKINSEMNNHPMARVGKVGGKVLSKAFIAKPIREIDLGELDDELLIQAGIMIAEKNSGKIKKQI